MKECGQCGKVGRISGDDPEFYRREASKDGFQAFCKECSVINTKDQAMRKKHTTSLKREAKRLASIATEI